MTATSGMTTTMTTTASKTMSMTTLKAGRPESAIPPTGISSSPASPTR